MYFTKGDLSASKWRRRYCHLFLSSHCNSLDLEGGQALARDNFSPFLPAPSLMPSSSSEWGQGGMKERGQGSSYKPATNMVSAGLYSSSPSCLLMMPFAHLASNTPSAVHARVLWRAELLTQHTSFLSWEIKLLPGLFHLSTFSKCPLLSPSSYFSLIHFTPCSTNSLYNQTLDKLRNCPYLHNI